MWWAHQFGAFSQRANLSTTQGQRSPVWLPGCIPKRNTAPRASRRSAVDSFCSGMRRIAPRYHAHARPEPIMARPPPHDPKGQGAPVVDQAEARRESLDNEQQPYRDCPPPGRRNSAEPGPRGFAARGRSVAGSRRFSPVVRCGNHSSSPRPRPRAGSR